MPSPAVPARLSSSAGCRSGRSYGASPWLPAQRDSRSGKWDSRLGSPARWQARPASVSALRGPRGSRRHTGQCSRRPGVRTERTPLHYGAMALWLGIHFAPRPRRKAQHSTRREKRPGDKQTHPARGGRRRMGRASGRGGGLVFRQAQPATHLATPRTASPAGPLRSDNPGRSKRAQCAPAQAGRTARAA